MDTEAVLLVVIGSVAGLVLAIWIWYKVAKEFYSIAKKKGYQERKYFWWTFFLGIVGMLMVIALPTVGTEKQMHRTVVSDELPNL